MDGQTGRTDWPNGNAKQKRIAEREMNTLLDETRVIGSVGQWTRPGVARMTSVLVDVGLDFIVSSYGTTFLAASSNNSYREQDNGKVSKSLHGDSPEKRKERMSRCHAFTKMLFRNR